MTNKKHDRNSKLSIKSLTEMGEYNDAEREKIQRILIDQKHSFYEMDILNNSQY